MRPNHRCLKDNSESEWMRKNERGLDHDWMKVVNYGWQYSKEHPPPPLLLLMEPHVQKAKKLLLSMIEHKSRLGPIHLSFVWKNRLTLDFFYKTKIIFWRVFASFENQTFHFLGQNHDSILFSVHIIWICIPCIEFTLGFAPNIARLTLAFLPSIIGLGSLHAFSAPSLVAMITWKWQ